MRYIDDVYEFALELATTSTGATAIGVAATVTPAGPVALAGPVAIWNDAGEVFTAERILELVPAEQGRAYIAHPPLERRVAEPEPGEPASLRWLLAIAAIRSVAVIRSELALALERGEHLPPDAG